MIRQVERGSNRWQVTVERGSHRRWKGGQVERGGGKGEVERGSGLFSDEVFEARLVGCPELDELARPEKSFMCLTERLHGWRFLRSQ